MPITDGKVDILYRKLASGEPGLEELSRLVGSFEPVLGASAELKCEWFELEGRLDSAYWALKRLREIILQEFDDAPA